MANPRKLKPAEIENVRKAQLEGAIDNARQLVGLDSLSDSTRTITITVAQLRDLATMSFARGRLSK